MGLFSIFKKKVDNKEDHVKKINEILKSSFSNVKKDMLHVHKKVLDHTDSSIRRFERIEKRLERMEITLNVLQQTQKHQRIIIDQPQIEQSKKIQIEEDIVPEIDFEQEDEVLASQLKGIPQAELKLFKTLCDLQQSLNLKHISYKSLASYLYPGKDYNSIRSTITQFVLRLYTEGLIDKQRIGKETFIKLTTHGHKVLKNQKTKKIIKELEAKD